MQCFKSLYYVSMGASSAHTFYYFPKEFSYKTNVKFWHWHEVTVMEFQRIEN